MNSSLLRRKILSVLVTIALLFSMVPTAFAADEDKVTFSINQGVNLQGNVGDTISVPIYIDSLPAAIQSGERYLSGVSLVVTYDPTVLYIQNAQEGAGFNRGDFDSNYFDTQYPFNHDAGRITIVYSAVTGGIKQPRELFKIDFKILSKPVNDTANITLELGKLGATVLKPMDDAYGFYEANVISGVMNISLPPIPPVATNVVVNGNKTVGETVYGTYDYSDENGEPEDVNATQFRWLRSDSENGNYTPIQGATSVQYKLTKDDRGKYIKLEVTPAAQTNDANTKFGQPVLSPAFGPINPTNNPPEIKSASISGSTTVGSTLTLNYEFEDENGFADESTFEWFTSSDANYADSEVIQGATGKTLQLTADMENKYIYAIVTPKSDGNRIGLGFKTDAVGPVTKQPAAPTAENVRITPQTARVGVQLTGEYDFVDINGDPEGDSIYSWYISDTKDGTYTPIAGANSKTYTPKAEDEGKFLKFGVIPVSTVEPKQGVSTLSDAVGPVGGPLDSANAIISTSIGVLSQTGVKDIPYGTTVAELKAALEVSPGATVEILTGPAGNVITDGATILTDDMRIQVTAENGEKKEYTIKVDLFTVTATFKANTDNVTSLDGQAGKFINAFVNVKNNDNQNKDVVILAVSYNSNGAMLAAAANQTTVAGNGTATLQAGLLATSDVHTIKVFVLDGTNYNGITAGMNFTPISNEKVLSKTSN